VGRRLPAGYRLRNARPEDAAAVLELMRAIETALHGAADVTLDEILEEWALPRLEPREDLWLIERGGELAGYGFSWLATPPHLVDTNPAVHPAHRGQGLSGLLLDLGEARALDVARRAPDGHVSLGVWSDVLDEARLALFRRRGYAPARTFLRMEVELTRAVADPVWPPGITVATFRPGVDDERVHAATEEAFRDHFRPDTMDLDEWRRFRLTRADLDLGLWFVAWDGDRVAGSALSFALPDAGLVDELSVRRPWRGRGLGRALLQHSLAALWRRGVRRAYLGVDSANPTGAMRVYESAGMRPTREHTFMTKDVVAPQ
jgi:mycothiol synthase